MTRKYSIHEIARMRQALQTLLTPPTFPYSAIEKNAEIEGQLRTYMLAGTEPEELEKEASKALQMRSRQL